MKVALASDVHLEFGPIIFENPGDVDVLILSGDICTAKELDWAAANMYGDMKLGKKAQQYHEFFSAASHNFKHVIYVVGNHEHYNYDFAYTIPHIKNQLKGHKNFHLLDKECIKIDDVTFVGGTMWTNMNNEDPLTLFHIKSMMNDFRCVQNSNRKVSRKVPIYEQNLLYTEDGKNGPKYTQDEKGFHKQIGFKHIEEPSRFCPEDAVEDFKQFTAYLQSVIEGKNDEKFVVCTHHTPSRKSCHPRYGTDHLMNGGYHSDLDEYIIDHPQIKLWTHGHTHEDFDYMIGETRVACNPRGYINYEQRANEFKLKIMEI